MTSETEKALATSVVALDGARRVGWAKAYAAQGRAEGLEAEVARLQSELEAMREAYSRLLGYTSTLPLPLTPAHQEEMSLHLRAERGFRHPGGWNTGQSRARRHREDVQAGNWTTRAHDSGVPGRCRVCEGPVRQGRSGGYPATCSRRCREEDERSKKDTHPA